MDSAGNVSIYVNYALNQSSLNRVNKSISGLNSHAITISNSFTGAFSKIAGAAVAAFSVSAISNFTKSCIELSSNLTEVQNVVDVTFRQFSSRIDEFAKTSIEKFGISQLSAKRYASTMGAMLKSSGIASLGQVTDMSEKITGLAADMASFYNISSDDAFAKIRSGMSGMTAPLKELGISMTVANLQSYALTQGITKSYKTMNNAEKTMLRYNYLMSVTADAQGDFLRTQDTWANQTRILTEKFNALKGTLGGAFISVLEPALKMLVNFMDTLQVVADRFASFVTLITGKKTDTMSTAKAQAQANALAASTDTASDSVDGLADSYKAAGTAAKKASESLASFDNTVQLGSSSSSSGSGTSNTASVDSLVDDSSVSETSTAVDKITEKFKGLKKYLKGFVKDIFKGTDFKENFSSIANSLKTIFEKTKPSAKNFFSSYINAMFVEGKELLRVGVAIVDAFVGGIEIWLSEGKNRIAKSWTSIFDEFSEGFNNSASIMTNFGGLLSDFFKLDSTKQAIGDALTTVEGFITGAMQLFSQLYSDITATIDQIISDNTGGLTLFFSNISTVIGLEMSNVKTLVIGVFSSINKAYTDYIKPAFSQFADGASSAFGTMVDLWNTYLLPTVIDIQKSFKTLWDENLGPFVDKVCGIAGRLIELVAIIYKQFIVPFIEKFEKKLIPAITVITSMIWGLFSSAVSSIVDVFSGLADIINGVLDVIIGALTGDTKRLVSGLKEILAGFVNTLASILTMPLNAIIGSINGFIKGVNKIKIPEGIPGVGGVSFNIAEIPKIKIPKLADGGIVTKETNFGSYIAGERGAEAIVPLQNSNYTRILAQEIVKGMVDAGIGGGDTYQIENAYGDERSMNRLLNNIATAQAKKKGNKGGLSYGY
jgi:DNA-binding ferritin-like protein